MSMPKVLQDEDSIEVVTYSDLLILACIAINTVFISVEVLSHQQFIKLEI